MSTSAVPGPDPDAAANSGWPSLDTSERGARRMVEGGAGVGRRMLAVLLAEYDRRGTADVDHWRTRALTAESRVDGQAWADLEAERDRLRGDAENWKARFHAACTDGDDQAFRIFELRSTLVKASNAATWERACEIMEEALRLPAFTDLLADSSLGTPEALACRAVGREEIAKLRAAASPGAPTEIDPDEGPAFFAAAMAKHGRCWCGVDADGGFCGDCPLCAVLPPDWPCPTIAHSGYPLPAASSPPVQEHPAPAPASDLQTTADLGAKLGDSDPAKPQASALLCDARISPSWSSKWVRCGSLISGGRCDAFGHGPAAQPPVSSPGEPPTGSAS